MGKVIFWWENDFSSTRQIGASRWNCWNRQWFLSFQEWVLNWYIFARKLWRTFKLQLTLGVLRFSDSNFLALNIKGIWSSIPYKIPIIQMKNPTFSGIFHQKSFKKDLNKLAEWTGLEPATPGVTGRYSNQLNYHSSFTAVTTAVMYYSKTITIQTIQNERALRKSSTLQ